MLAKELNGTYVGKYVRFVKGERYVCTDMITMITHKKNGDVIIRSGKNNRQHEVRGTAPVWEVYYD